MNLTIINQSGIQLLQQDYVTYANCVDYTEGLRSNIKGMGIFILILLIYIILINIRNIKK